MANLDLINQYRELQKKVKKQLQTEGTEIAKELFKQFFQEHPGLTKLVINGYTPGFNDGEPCVHEQRIVCGTSWGAEKKYFDFSDYDLEEFFEFNKENNNHVNASCESLKSLEGAMEDLKEILEGIYGTCWELKISYSNGEVSIEQEDYDCGY